ncbi:MAG: decarboxylase [Jatrophihabitans sp.]|nr:decarboxylase [Jatrophihabitans sp.]
MYNCESCVGSAVVGEALLQTTAFDALSAPAAEALLRAACASSAWIEAMVIGRPYGSFDALAARSDETLAGLTWPDLEEALAAHPRIGDRAGGEDRAATWSREEQSGTGAAQADVAAALRDGNVAYEQRFGHIFLICATGRTAEQLLTALRERLANDDPAEREVVRRELTAIVRLRLAKTLE